MTWLLRIGVWLLEQAMPLPLCLAEVWKNKSRIRKNADTPLGENEAYLTVDIVDLKESHKAVLSLREQLQRRAQGYLMAVTVASSFSLGALSLLTRVQNASGPHLSMSCISRAMLLAVLISFFVSAMSALFVLGPSEVFDVWLRSQLPKDENRQKADLIRFTQLNESYTMAYGHLARYSYNTMRNGVVLLLMWLAGMIVAPSWIL